MKPGLSVVFGITDNKVFLDQQTIIDHDRAIIDAFDGDIDRR